MDDFNLFEEDRRIQNQMEQVLPSYDSYMEQMTSGQECILREKTISMAGVNTGDCILDIGCGTGTLALAIKRRTGPSGKVFGIDIISGMIEISKRKAEKEGEDVSFGLGSINNIPFPNEMFDVIFCSFMIFHMSEGVRLKGIAEIRRVLKPQGRVLVVDLASPVDSLLETGVKDGSLQPHDVRELLSLMETAGFTNVEFVPMDFRIPGQSIIGCVSGIACKN